MLLAPVYQGAALLESIGCIRLCTHVRQAFQKTSLHECNAGRAPDMWVQCRSERRPNTQAGDLDCEVETDKCCMSFPLARDT